MTPRRMDDALAAAASQDTFTCTAESPWKPSIRGYVIHADACETGEQEDGWPAGDIVTMKCPNCGHVWRMELPQ